MKGNKYEKTYYSTACFSDKSIEKHKNDVYTKSALINKIKLIKKQVK